MTEPAIYSEPAEVNKRLARFGITKTEILEIVWAALQARRDTTANHAANAPGTFAYHEGLRTMRDVLGPKGWVRDNQRNIESAVNTDIGVRLIFQNVDVATQRGRKPQAIAGKGPAAERMLDDAAPYLFEDMEAERQRRLERAEQAQACEPWFLCVSEDGHAELSRPADIVNRQFGDFAERIFAVTADDSDDTPDVEPAVDPEPDEGDDAFEPEVSRKQDGDV